MIIVNIMGGLGNQMFQYAAARHLAILNDTELKIDSSNFYRHTANREHTLQIQHFRITAAEATFKESRRFRRYKKRHYRFLRSLGNLLRRSPQQDENLLYYEETGGSRFNPEFFAPASDRYLFGYFNSYKYFDPIRELLMREFAPREEPGEEARNALKLMESTNSVSIHFRRGDYVTDPNIKSGVSGIITDDYYRNAISHISEAVETPHFFVFSNDIGWARENFSVPFEVTFIGFNPPQRGYEDLWLMSRCRHNITAGGSSFSWWAAYLNPNEEKIVIRTKDVNGDPKFNHPDDFFPPGWRIAAS
jgi:hypothetical protein